MIPETKHPYIIAIDPGLRNVGYAVYNNKKIVIAGVIVSKAPRLKHIFSQLSDLVKTIEPTKAIIETTFVRNGLKSSLDLAGARGVICLAMQMHNVPICDMAANSARKTVLGNGRASKKEVTNFVSRHMGQKLNHNLADAILLLMAYNKFHII